MKIIYLTIREGKIDIEKSDSIDLNISSLQDGLYKLTLSKVGRRSNAQNNYYFGVVLEIIARHTGTSKDELHELFKQMFLYDVEHNSTTEKNTSEFMEYVDAIKDYALVVRGIKIPDAQN